MKALTTLNQAIEEMKKLASGEYSLSTGWIELGAEMVGLLETSKLQIEEHETELTKLIDLISREQMSKAEVLIMLQGITGTGTYYDEASTEKRIREYDEFLEWKRQRAHVNE